MNVDELAAGLAPAGLYADLGPRDLADLAAAAAVRRFRRGQVLWRAGAPARGLVVVLDGEIRVLRARRGRQHLVHVSGPGATMGEVPLFAGSGYPATAVASSDGACIVILPDAVRALAARNAPFASRLLRRVCRRLSALIDRLEANTLGDVRTRLAASILGLAAEAGAARDVAVPTQADWAEDLGTVREVLARELRWLEEAGLVERAGRGRLRILEEAGLEELALAR